ncbi:AMP-binding enzyme [Colletotrichum graminicola M1.001]|uniref:AMP-binding enzyme n=1 Tax=Colletotrichum graminicola (strain M1.001 / M2 / FGSC 10212) TaxID=645133 RepID=E3QQE3_COLGM|nr:AMP-binding enzyme [Colletotrichum graminicola M1.001]EFQ33081.1 AMP-binding enzyme [Colletotrichum graminicola M1.001]
MANSASAKLLPRIDTSMAPFLTQSADDRLISAIALVLSLPKNSIELFDSFSDLGGDRPSAIALRKTCMSLGLDVRTGDILRCHTLAELQTCITPLVQAAPVSKDSEEDSASPSDVFSSSPRRNSAYSTSSCESSSNSVDSPPVKAPHFEIEQFIQSTPQVRTAAVIRPKAGYLEDKLVAFVTLASGRVSQSSLSSIRLIPQSQMHFAGSQVAAVRLALETSGGAHTVPNSWIVLDQMPSNGEGSVDRRRLQTWIQNINEDMYHQISSLESNELFQEPLTEMERVLQKNVANVLRLPLRQIGMNFSFSQLGGDDISAMMLVSACRTESIIVRPEDIQKCPTLGQLASLAYRKSQRSDTWSEESVEGFKLSPIQQMYFDTGMGGRIEQRMASSTGYRFNQSLLLRVKNNATLENIHAAISTIVGHHSMLRARFKPETDGWTQRIVPKVDGSYGFRYHSVSTTEEVMGIVAQSQATINIESGPVFAVDHFRTHDGQQLVYLLAHHLVVDMMSWRIILHDLDELLREGTLFSERSMPFQRWNELQEEYIINNPEELVMPFQLPSGEYNYWGLDDSHNTYGEISVASFTLSPALTSILHTACNQVFKTDMSDIYMAALLLSFSQTFHDRPAPVIWSQEHGREPWSQDMDITETVGWFTSLCPVTMPIDLADDFLHVLRKMKDTRRSIPRRGWCYFGSRYFGPEAATRSDEGWPLEIMFTYAGSVQQIEREKGVLEQVTIPGRLRSTEAADIGSEVSRIALFEVSAMVDQGSASIQIVYNRNSKHQEKITEWVQAYEHLLYEAIGRLRYRGQELTLSDVPMLNTSYEGLAKLNTDRLVALGLSSAKDIEDVMPVTALQQEILISQTQDIGICHSHAVYELASPNGVVADQAQICTIWQQIVAKYPALRTVFIDSISEDGLFDQVVLRRCSPNMLFVDAEAGTDPVAVLNALPPMSPTPYNPRHRVSVCKSHASTFLRLDISHALCDALSLQNIVWDLKRMYNSSKACLKVLDPSHAACIQYISNARQENSLNFWLGRLQDTNPCLFPRLMTLNDAAMRHTNFRTELPMAQIDEFCRSQDVSRSALMQMAWALALRAFTGSDQVCFGYRSSGRDAADAPEGLALSVGAFENTTTCSVGLENHKSIASVLRCIEDDAAACRPHQSVPISEIRHALGLKGDSLFNTCLSYQEEPHELKSRFSSTRMPMRLSCIQAFNAPDFDVTFSLTLVNGQLITGVSHRLMTASQAENLTNTFGRAVLSIIGSPAEETLGSINLFTDRDYAQLLISDWEVDSGNEPAHACVHALVSQQGRRTPDSPAICAWDGGLTYRQVCRLVSRLATFLVQWGVRPGVAVPVILDKNKAGGCFVPIDAEDRANVETFIRQLAPKIVVATDLGWKSLEFIVEGVIVVDDSLFEVNFPPQAPLPMAAPDDAACMLLSPRSSRGKDAKGIIFHHAALSSAFLTQGRALNLNRDSRVMQLSSLNVDTALVELLSTLVHGGCVCIPSSVETTSDIVGAACRMDVNWTYMTPVLARKMTPAAIPSLKTVCFRTRRLDEDTCAPWMAKTKVLLAYGAPDTCPLGVSVLEVTKPSDLSRVAPPFLGRFWIVNPEDHGKLMPIGALGELIIESPTLAHHFVPGQSLSHLPQDSDFSLEDGKPTTRYFKTGHLVRYMEDGLLDFVSSGRDAVESNGRVVPVTEIEQRLRRCLGQGLDLAIESIISRDAQPSLAAFVELGENLFEGSEDLTRITITTRERTYIAKKLIESSLGTGMPSHMMPTIFVPVKHLPVTPSLKVNRRKLQKMVGWLSHEQLQALSTVASPEEVRSVGIKPLPLTKVEERMQSIWASLLGTHPSSIRGNQSFSMLGGQGFLAGQLVVACRKQGLIISLLDVLRGATLTELCQSITMSSDHALEAAVEPEPSASSVRSSTESLLDEQFIQDVIAPKLKVEPEAIDDVAEAAASQLKFLEAGLLKGSSSLTYFTFSFTGPVQTKKLEAVCMCLARIHPILRTAFVTHGRKVYQVALKSFTPEFKRVEVPNWRVSTMTEKIIKRDQTGSFDLEVPMTKFFFIDAGKQSNLVLRLSGAQYDGASISLLLHHLKSIYIAPSCPPKRATYFDFARSVQLAHNNGAKEHWTSLLNGAKMTQVIAHSKPPAMSTNVKTISKTVSVMSLANIGISFDTVVKSAWAMTLATLSGSGDVFFGEIVEGRHLRLADGSDISGTLGPVSNAIPVRVQFADTLSSPLELLKYVHSQRISSIPFENMGWLEIVEKCTKLPYWTRFSTVVEHRHQDAAKEAAVFNIGTIKCKFNIQQPISRDVYDLHVISTQQDSSSGEISLTFCENRMPGLFANETLKALCSNIELLTSVSMLHPLIPSSVDYCDVAAQIPLPQLQMEAKPTAVAATLSESHRTAIQEAISRVWTKVLNPRSLGVPKAQLHNAAFYDLWGSMISASLLAEALTQQLPKLGIPGSHSLTVSMEEIMAHPTMAEQCELVARKMRDAKRRTFIEVLSPKSHPSWGRGLKRLSTTVAGEKASHERNLSSASASSSISVEALKGLNIQQPAPSMHPIAEGAGSGDFHSANPTSPMGSEERWRARPSLAVEHDGRSMESMTTGSSRTEEETEVRRASAERKEEGGDVVSPLREDIVPTPMRESRLRRKAGSVLHRISLVSPVGVSGPRLGHH